MHRRGRALGRQCTRARERRLRGKSDRQGDVRFPRVAGRTDGVRKMLLVEPKQARADATGPGLGAASTSPADRHRWFLLPMQRLGCRVTDRALATVPQQK